MSVMLVVPEGSTVPDVGKDVIIKEIPESRAIAFNFSPPHGTFIIVPEPTTVSSFPALITSAIREASQHTAVAFVSGDNSNRPVLATAAAAYAFDALPLHLAGGLDSTISIQAMCLDAMIRLAGRGAQPVSCPDTSILATPVFPVSAYLDVIARNFSPDTMGRYLTPVFLATLTVPMHATNTDTSILDLERTPYSLTEDNSARELPEGSNDGVQAIHAWWHSAQLGNFAANCALKPFRRRPDALLPNLNEFFEEATRATGIAHDAALALCHAFADTTYNSMPRVLFVVDGTSPALERMNTIRISLPYEVNYYDVATHKYYTSSSPNSTWQELDGLKTREHPVIYLINTQIQSIPWLHSSDAIVIADFTCTDIDELLHHDIPTKTIRSFHSEKCDTVLSRTLTHADRIIARDSVQHDFLLGALAGLHRLNQYTYDEDLSLSSLVSTEHGVRSACSAIETCLHPYDAVMNSTEYEQNLFDAAAPPPPPSLLKRAVNKAHRMIVRGEQ